MSKLWLCASVKGSKREVVAIEGKIAIQERLKSYFADVRLKLIKATGAQSVFPELQPDGGPSSER